MLNTLTLCKNQKIITSTSGEKLQTKKHAKGQMDGGHFIGPHFVKSVIS